MLNGHRKQAGVTLIEMMVGLVIALIVSGAAIAFIASIMRSTSTTVSATRLSSELRSNAEIVSRELRRARFFSDPIADIGSGCIAASNCQSAAVSTVSVSASCVQFAYDTPQGRRFQAIRVDAGQLQMGWGNATVDCNAATTPVSSGQVELMAPTSGQIFEQLSANSIRIQMRGRFSDNPSKATDKTYTTIVAIRSQGV